MLQESQDAVSSAETKQQPKQDPSESTNQDSLSVAKNVPTRRLKGIAGIRFQRNLYLTEWERPAFLAIINDGRYLMHILEKDEYAKDDDRFRDFIAYTYLLYYPGASSVSPKLKAKLKKMNKPKYRCAFPRLHIPKELENGQGDENRLQVERYSAIPIRSPFFQNIANMAQ